jgi:hypothetical protein
MNIDDLPEFKRIFVSTNNQIRNFGDGIFLAEFSFLVNEILFRGDLGDKGKNVQVEVFRNLIYEIFNNRRGFVDSNARKLAENNQFYIQNLLSQGMIYLWMSLEALVKQLIATIISFDKEILATESLKRIKIPKERLSQLDDDEKSASLTDLIINRLNCRDKYGIDRFECFLSPFELDGVFKDDHKNRVLVLHHLRNCIAHNDSIADARLCKNCGWMGFQIGDKIVVTGDEYRGYERSVLAYIGELYIRLNRKLGAPVKFLDTLRGMFDRIPP